MKLDFPSFACRFQDVQDKTIFISENHDNRLLVNQVTFFGIKSFEPATSFFFIERAGKSCPSLPSQATYYGFTFEKEGLYFGNFYSCYNDQWYVTPLVIEVVPYEKFEE